MRTNENENVSLKRHLKGARETKHENNFVILLPVQFTAIILFVIQTHK
jgi:hypothetical protein